MVILLFADIFGRVGRQAVAAALPDLIARYTPDFILGNAENLAGGRGTNRKTFNTMMDLGFHALTGGNHTWDNKDVYNFIDSETRLFRPANLPSSAELPCPGRGYGLVSNGHRSVFIINLLGRVFMDAVDCPFATVDRILKEAPANVPILVDFHADATSEMNALGWYLAGRVTAVTGSHSHVQTADERILPGGTAYITDVGLSGSFDSVIGLDRNEVIRKFITKRQTSFLPAHENPGVSCVVIKVDMKNKATEIERLRFPVETRYEADKDLDREL